MFEIINDLKFLSGNYDKQFSLERRKQTSKRSILRVNSEQVEIERQKLVVKGQYLKHGKPLSSYAEIKAGATINLIGSPETGIKIPLKPWSTLWIGIRLVYSIYCTKNMLQADQWWQSSEIAYSMVYGTLPIHSEDNSDTLRVN